MKTMTITETPFRTLGDEELSEVSGGRRHHCCRRRRDRDLERSEGGSGGAGDLDSLLQMILQGNLAAIFQFVIGDGNTVTAGVSQGNLAR
jgi:hypothetical protein